MLDLLKHHVYVQPRGKHVLSPALCLLSRCAPLPPGATWVQTRWCGWSTRASARGRGPSISKPGPFYAACATCQVMTCSRSRLPKQAREIEIRALTVLSSVLCQSSAAPFTLIRWWAQHRKNKNIKRRTMCIMKTQCHKSTTSCTF